MGASSDAPMHNSFRPDRKTAQLSAAIERALQTSLACDVEDPELDDVTLDRVEPVPGGFIAVFFTNRLELVRQLQERVRDQSHIFREALARDLARKRVPTVSYVVVPVFGTGADGSALG